MRLLAFDTSTEYLSLALWQPDALAVREMPAGQRHSELILPLVRELLDAAGVPLRELDGIVFGAGPGSFTGLRIACGVAQGLAWGAGLPVLGVCTLEALAQQAGASRVIACLDARMGEVYHAAYQKSDAGWDVVAVPALMAPAQAPMLAGAGWCAIGSGWDAHGAALGAVYGAQVDSVRAQALPLARHMAELAAPRLARGEGRPAHEARPFYVRDKVALTRREREVAR